MITLPSQLISVARKLALLGVFAMPLLASCQQETEAGAAATDATTVNQATPDTTRKRPAPAFFLIPPGMERNRVWICDDAASDLFHTKPDCPVLLQCQGKGNYRNVSLLRAIESYGRYNCQTCSEELNYIFDEDLVR